MTLPALILNKREDRRLRAGHDWVFSNEVDNRRSPLKAFAPGDIVEVQGADGRPIGTGYVNPHSLICARLMSRDPAHPPSASLIVHRLNIALALRERIYAAPFYRLVYGESDGLPGLVVDRYDDVLVAQITTAGMEAMRSEVIDALTKVLKPRGILLRNDSSIREMEGLTRYVETAAGEVPEQVEVREGDARFSVSLAGGQKTGWFFDQRDNRARLGRYVRGARVLDVFSYVGAWGVRAALDGASEVLCVDASSDALASARANGERNGVEIATLEGDAFEAMRQLRDGDERFDVVIVDPPAFIKRKKDMEAGTQAYRRLNQLAMQLLPRDGILVSASCSYHLGREALVEVIQGASRHLNRHAAILEFGGQGPDHPVHPAIRETDYLKACFVRVVSG